jgi:sigma-B regulation protein RsbU (phosphoserine phosphatase)
MSSQYDLFDVKGGWQERMALIVDTMREMSKQTDPQVMVRAYGERINKLRQIDRRISLSRRDLSWPKYRITRSTTWDEEIDPWKQKDRLPLFAGGLLAELIYGDEPQIIDNIEYDASDPAAEYLAGMRSLMAIPMYDQGMSLNMVVVMRTEPAAFPREQFPQWVWLSNLFGRAAHNLVLSADLKTAYDAIDRELKIPFALEAAPDPHDGPGGLLPDVQAGGG